MEKLKLSIPESIMLIALDDEHGYLSSPALNKIPYTLSATILFELYLLKRIALKEKEVAVINRSGTGLLVLDKGLQLLPNKEALRTTIHKMSSSHGKNLIKATVDMLLARGIIEKNSEHIFGLPVANRWDNANYSFEQRVRNEIIGLFDTDDNAVSAHLLVCVTMLSCSGLLDEIFLRKEDSIAAKHRLQDMLQAPSGDMTLKKVLLEMHCNYLNTPEFRGLL